MKSKKIFILINLTDKNEKASEITKKLNKSNLSHRYGSFITIHCWSFDNNKDANKAIKIIKEVVPNTKILKLSE